MCVWTPNTERCKVFLLTCIHGVLSGRLQRCCTATIRWQRTTRPVWHRTADWKQRHVTSSSHHAVLAIVTSVKWKRLYSQLTANPKAEALWRMMETAGMKTEWNVYQQAALIKCYIYIYRHEVFFKLVLKEIDELSPDLSFNYTEKYLPVFVHWALGFRSIFLQC